MKKIISNPNMSSKQFLILYGCSAELLKQIYLDSLKNINVNLDDSESQIQNSFQNSWSIINFNDQPSSVLKSSTDHLSPIIKSISSNSFDILEELNI